VYTRFLSVALQEPAVKIVNNFGLSDRYTWLQEDYPRRDGAARRPLPFDENLQPKPAYNAILQAFQNAPSRTPI
jgi:endo-1,4-beta-xylanase